MFKDKDKMVREILVSISKKKPGDESVREPKPSSIDEEGSDDGMEVAAEEIISAVKAGDARGLAEALKAFIEQC